MLAVSSETNLGTKAERLSIEQVESKSSNRGSVLQQEKVESHTRYTAVNQDARSYSNYCDRLQDVARLRFLRSFSLWCLPFTCDSDSLQPRPDYHFLHEQRETRQIRHVSRVDMTSASRLV
jgi:methylase of polypeptide subunit release factors